MSKATDILDAALELFEGGSYGSTPVPALAQRAGVGTGTIYRHFPGKEGVVNALYQRWKTALAARLLDELQPSDPEATFREIWRRLCSFVIEQPAAFAFLESHHHQQYLDAESRRIGDELDTAMTELIAIWQRAGKVRSGPASLMVAQAYGGLVGVARAHRDRGLALPADLADQTATGAWNLLSLQHHPEKENST
ncbi:MAG: TetR/AcrR family transcriptional regulator [Actinobacteria bacterium]|nr:TetR/AcrR family transcriptional regulator [Actinomycetota bacterium]